MASPRASSDDRVVVHRLDDGLVVVVADGAGGISGGAAAADALCAMVDGCFKRRSFEPFAPYAWADLLRQADLALERGRGCGEAAAVIAAVSSWGVVGASAGDARAVM